MGVNATPLLKIIILKPLKFKFHFDPAPDWLLAMSRLSRDHMLNPTIHKYGFGNNRTWEMSPEVLH